MFDVGITLLGRTKRFLPLKLQMNILIQECCLEWKNDLKNLFFNFSWDSLRWRGKSTKICRNSGWYETLMETSSQCHRLGLTNVWRRGNICEPTEVCTDMNTRVMASSKVTRPRSRSLRRFVWETEAARLQETNEARLDCRLYLRCGITAETQGFTRVDRLRAWLSTHA